MKKRRLSCKIPLQGLSILFLLLSSCSSPEQRHHAAEKTDSGFTQYAQGFTLDTIPGYRLLTVIHHWGNRSMEQRWLLEDSAFHCPDCEIPDSLRALPILHLPLQRMVVLSSTHLALLQELEVTDRVIGISRRNLVHNPQIRKALKRDEIIEVGYGPSIQIESVLNLAPDAVLTFAVGDTQMDDFHRLTAARIPTVVLSAWLERHPLGRLEWIRLAGILVGKEARADSIFQERVARYDSIAHLTAHLQTHERPQIFTGMPQGDSWHISGGKSYLAQFIHDAGARYLFDDDTTSSGYQSSFEQVYKRAMEADFWLHPGIWNSQQEALKSEPRVSLFQAFQQQKMVQSNKRQFQEGGNDYWELGMVRPDLVLMDLVHFFHPELLANDSTTFFQILPAQ